MKYSKSEQTKEYIIEKIAPIFNTKGYAGTSISDIMEETGLSKGCIYGNFENKDELALAAFEYNHNKVNELMRSKILERENSIDRLLVYPRIYKNYFRYPFLHAGCPILNSATEVDDTHPMLRERVVQALDFWRTSLEKQIKRGIHRKEIHPLTHPKELAILIISLIEGSFMQSKLNNRLFELKIAMNYLENLIISCKL